MVRSHPEPASLFHVKRASPKGPHMITVYWTHTRELQVSVTVDELLAAVAKSGQEAPARESDQEYVSRVMDEIDMDEVLPFLADHEAVEINDESRTMDDWEEATE